MISIPINKSSSQISVVSSKLAPRRKREREREREGETEKKGKKGYDGKKLERILRRLSSDEEGSLFSKWRQR